MLIEKEAFVDWEERYAVGIAVIDEQHKELLKLTNGLYEACCQGDDIARSQFQGVVHSMVDYVKFHFTTEEQIMERVNYPELAEHKREHESFIRKIFEGVKAFESGKSFVPNTFVRYLRDWVLTHIAMSDRKYTEYILRVKKGGA